MKKLNSRWLGLGALCLAASFHPATYAQEAQPVPKSTSNKVYAHLMPWFEAKEHSGYWGIHWTMANKNPDNIDGSGKREIAAHYYPMIGPYASGDRDVVEYQLLTMKLAGIDGVLIDWPGTTNAMDYVRNRENAEAFIDMVDDVGMEFAVVYEDHNLILADVGDKLGQARNDMNYLRDNYFNRNEYTKVNGHPLMLVFGPQTFQSPAEWDNVFSVLPNKPHFLTLWYENGEAGANSSGEYAWIYQDDVPYYDHLSNFYQYADAGGGTKMGAAAPGFHSFYQEGGWGSNAFHVPHNGLDTFTKTLDLALSNNAQHIQLATWNDYGEGTMIEPTREFGYGFLTTLQQRLGVPLNQGALELVHELFVQRKQHKGNAGEQARLDKAFRQLRALQIDEARATLTGTQPPTPPPADTVATLYQHCNYEGYSINLAPGRYTLSQLNALGLQNDDISSLRLQSGYTMTMYQHDNFVGNTVSKSGDDTCLVDDGFNDDISSLIIESSSNSWSTRIEAEDYTFSADIGVEACSEGGSNIGWLDAGDWVVWNINLPSSGTYRVEYRIAGLGGGRIQLEKAGGSPVYGQLDVPVTGDWQNWQTISHTVELSAGSQEIAIYIPASGFNINWIQFTKI